jgi:hypothetical protein
MVHVASVIREQFWWSLIAVNYHCYVMIWRFSFGRTETMPFEQVCVLDFCYGFSSF